MSVKRPGDEATARDAAVAIVSSNPANKHPELVAAAVESLANYRRGEKFTVRNLLDPDTREEIDPAEPRVMGGVMTTLKSMKLATPAVPAEFWNLGSHKCPTRVWVKL